jgi:hypothetical protein
MRDTICRQDIMPQKTHISQGEPQRHRFLWCFLVRSTISSKVLAFVDLKNKINLRFFLTQVVLLCIVCNNLYKKRLCNDNDDNILDCVSELVVTTGFVNYAKNSLVFIAFHRAKCVVILKTHKNKCELVIKITKHFNYPQELANIWLAPKLKLRMVIRRKSPLFHHTWDEKTSRLSITSLA